MTTKTIKVKNNVLGIFTDSGGFVSTLAVLFGFLAATLLLVIIGRNPSGMYQALLQVISGFDSRRGTWNVRYAGEWLVLSTPIILCGLSMGFAVRSGLFNIGAEGQYIAGVTAAQFAAIYFPRISVLHPAVALCGALLAGAAWGGFAGFIKARYKVSEVVATIMMNYIALYLHRIITMKIPGSNSFRTPDFHVTVSLSSSFLSSISNGSRLNYGLWITAAVVIIYWLIMEKSVLGYSLQVMGFNKDAAVYSGMRVKTNAAIAMAVAGAFAGLAGGVVSLGTFTHGRIMLGFDGYGFDGIAAALSGNCKAAGVAVMGLLFGMLRSAQPLMQSRQIPREIASIIMGLIVVFISLRPGIIMFAEWQEKRKTQKQLSEGTGEIH